MTESFNILSIDGGGIRGVYAATILLKIQQELGIEYFHEFDLIVGTSTGSIIAAGLSLGIPIQEIVDLYIEESHVIFEKNKGKGIIAPKYNNLNLKRVLDGIFKNYVFQDAKTRLMIPATNLSDGLPWVFKSSYHDRLDRDKSVKIADAVLASCCAPSYFDPYVVDNQLLADGGLWANNPSLAGLVEALGRNIDTKKYKVKILSLGTGVNVKYYPLEWADKQWGMMRWGFKVIDIIYDMQSFSVEKYLRTIMLPEQYLRINFELQGKIGIDNLDAIPFLIEQATKDFERNKRDIKRLIGKDKTH